MLNELPFPTSSNFLIPSRQNLMDERIYIAKREATDRANSFRRNLHAEDHNPGQQFFYLSTLRRPASILDHSDNFSDFKILKKEDISKSKNLKREDIPNIPNPSNLSDFYVLRKEDIKKLKKEGAFDPQKSASSDLYILQDIPNSKNSSNFSGFNLLKKDNTSTLRKLKRKDTSDSKKSKKEETPNYIFLDREDPQMSLYGTVRGPPLAVPVLIYDTAPGYGPRELEPIPLFSVPYRGTPKYNTRRRLTNPILRRRSLSQSSICSAQSDRYQTPQQIRGPAMGLPSPSPSCLTMMPDNESQYSTLRRYPPNEVQSAPRAGFE